MPKTGQLGVIRGITVTYAGRRVYSGSRPMSSISGKRKTLAAVSFRIEAHPLVENKIEKWPLKKPRRG
jgi:hypothetical protein